MASTLLGRWLTRCENLSQSSRRSRFVKPDCLGNMAADRSFLTCQNSNCYRWQIPAKTEHPKGEWLDLLKGAKGTSRD